MLYLKLHVRETCKHWSQMICQSSEPQLYCGTDLEKATEAFASLWFPQWPHRSTMEEAWMNQEPYQTWTKEWAIILTDLQRSRKVSRHCKPPWSWPYGTAEGAKIFVENLIQSTQELRWGQRFLFQWDKVPWAEPRATLWIFLSGPVRPLAWTQFYIFLEILNYGCLPMVRLPADGTKLVKGQNNYVTAKYYLFIFWSVDAMLL